MTLWLCLRLPALALEVFQRAGGDDDARVVADSGAVVAANRPARRAGVIPGQRVSAARALVPRLVCHERDPAAEARALRQLAAWSLQFTPVVSPQRPDALLLEVGGSLRYFGGLERLRTAIADGVVGLGYRPLTSLAPTPTAAWLFARAGDTTAATTQPECDTTLTHLPVSVLSLEHPRQHEELTGLGCETLGDVLALPRDGLARRFGHALLRQLDRAGGRHANPRHPWQPPPRYRAEITLPRESGDRELIARGLERLLGELCGYLSGLGRGVQRLELRLHHVPRGASTARIGLLAPSRDAAHLRTLAHERLERLSLPGPVQSLTLLAGDLQPLAPESPALLPGAREETPWRGLVERLSTRLGKETVSGLDTRSEHRPERAWRYVAPGRGGGTPAPNSARPLWLLDPPRALTVTGEIPAWHGPLTLHDGPERIESGWWDGQDVARDYYVASNAGGERLWVYRERGHARGWFLHGLFA